VGKGEEVAVTAVRGSRSLGPLSNTEETEMFGRERGQRSVRRQEEGYTLWSLITFGPFKDEKYVIAGIQEKDRLVVRTGVIERFTTNNIDFFGRIQEPLFRWEHEGRNF